MQGYQPIQFGRVFQINDDTRRKRFMDSYKRNDHPAVAFRVDYVQSVEKVKLVEHSQGRFRVSVDVSESHFDTYVLTGDDACDISPMLPNNGKPSDVPKQISADDRRDFVSLLKPFLISEDAEIKVTILENYINRL